MVIPVEPGGSVVAALKALEKLPKAEKALIGEVFVAEGRHPSRQRNLAVERAEGRWILFLDSDSLLEAGSLPALLGAASVLKASVVGGPNLPLQDEPFWGQVFQGVLGSWAGSWTSRARYRAIGERRLSSEKELILCNLLVAKEAFAAVGGFREDLYPNEENELFNRMQAQGHRLAYDPQAVVRRPRRHSVGAFALQGFRYGRGRSQQMRANFFNSDLVNLAPLGLIPAWALTVCFPIPAMCAWWLLSLVAWSSASIDEPRGLGHLSWEHRRMNRGRAVGLYVPLFWLRHHAYALGLLVGLIQNAPERPLHVKVSQTRWRP